MAHGKSSLYVLAVFLYFTSSSQHPSCKKIRLGESLNIFSNYGTWVQRMRVLPLNDRKAWIFREPTEKIFSERRHVVYRGNITEWKVNMGHCRSFEELLTHYFRHFSIERLSKPWKAFVRSWYKKDLAWSMGIDEAYVGEGYSYMLLEVFRYRTKGQWSDNVRGTRRWPFAKNKGTVFNIKVSELAGSVVPGDVASVGRFVREYGTHYVSSYETGDSLYQTFVYKDDLRKHFADQTRKKGKVHKPERYSYLLSPKYAVHVGKIQVRSGNRSVSRWMQKRSVENVMDKHHATLLKIIKNEESRRTLDSLLTNGALLSLKLKSIGRHFTDNEKRAFFEEVVKSQLLLWEINS